MSYYATQELAVPPTQYELIDKDPVFSRVVRYMRWSDYAEWAGLTAAAPFVASILSHQYNPKQPLLRPAPHLARGAVVIGLMTGLFTAYSRLAMRLAGVRENAAEVSKDRYEIKKALSEYRLPYGEPLMLPELQKISTRTTTFGFKMLDVYPAFNFFNHPYHSDDFAKYYDVRKGEEEWGFDNLPSVTEIKQKIAESKENPQHFIDNTKEYLWKF